MDKLLKKYYKNKFLKLYSYNQPINLRPSPSKQDILIKLAIQKIRFKSSFMNGEQYLGEEETRNTLIVKYMKESSVKSTQP